MYMWNPCLGPPGATYSQTTLPQTTLFCPLHYTQTGLLSLLIHLFPLFSQTNLSSPSFVLLFLFPACSFWSSERTADFYPLSFFSNVPDHHLNMHSPILFSIFSLSSQDLPQSLINISTFGFLVIFPWTPWRHLANLVLHSWCLAHSNLQ